MAIKVQFIRALIDAVLSGHSSSAQEAIINRLPARAHELSQGLSSGTATLTFDDAESLLFSLDHALGDGSGRALEEVGAAYAVRILSENGQGPSSNPLFAMESFGRVMTQAIVMSELLLEINFADGTAELELAAPGYPTLTRLLRYLATGYVRGATRTEGQLRLVGETDGERALLRATVEEVEEDFSPSVRLARRSSIAPRPISLVAEIDAILGAAHKSAPERNG